MDINARQDADKKPDLLLFIDELPSDNGEGGNAMRTSSLSDPVMHISEINVILF